MVRKQSMHKKVIRSVLFTPALRVDRFASGLYLGADASLADLEDSIAANLKKEARKKVIECLSLPRPEDTHIVVRINPIASTNGLKDLDSLLGSLFPPNIILIPNVESAENVIHIEKLISNSGKPVKLIALIESVKGVHNVVEIAKSSSFLIGLMFGSADYTNDIGAEICWDSLFYPRSKIVHAAKLAKIQAIDTPYFKIDDTNGLAEECRRVKNMGFTGKCVIHPKQLDIVQQAFSPSKAELDYAIKVVEAADNSNGNICKVDGNMIGTPIILKARLLIDSFCT